MASIAIDDNDSLPASNADSPWGTTISVAEEAIAPFAGFFKPEKTSSAPSSTDQASSVEPAPELDKKGKRVMKANGKKKFGPSKKKGEKIVLEVREEAGEASVEKGGVKASDDQLGKIASQLVKAFEAKYGEGAELTEERLKELLAGEGKISIIVTDAESASTAHEPEPANDQDLEEETTSASPILFKTRKERIESLVLSRMDKPEEFDRSSVAHVELGTASPSQIIAESVRQANVGEFRGTVNALIAFEDQEAEIDSAVARARKAQMAASLEVGERVGWEKVMRERQEAWMAQPLEVKQAEMERRRIAEEQFALERRVLRKQMHAEKLAKVKAATKQFFWTYGGKILELGGTLALQALLKQFGAQEPEKIVREVFGLGQALQQVHGIGRVVEGEGSEDADDSLC